MVVTRSQGDAAELEQQRIEMERRRRLSLNPPASPAVMTGHTEEALRHDLTAATTSGLHTSEERPRSPTQSHRSTASATTRLRLAELEAAEKLASIQRKELEIEAELVKKRLAVEASVINDENDSVRSEPHDTPRRVEEWLRTTPNQDTKQLRFDVPRESRDRSRTPSRRNGIEQLAEAIERMARPRLRQMDLLIFTGAVNEWLTFKAAMFESTKMYGITASENLQRLRNCLRGEAREVVSALLHTATSPDTIMRTLEQCFGRPEVIIDRAIEELRKLPKPTSSATDLNSFAVRLQNIVCVLKSIDRKGYLYNPLLVREVLEKLSPHIKSRWCDYARTHEGTTDPEIVTLSDFLMKEADGALRYTFAPTPGPSRVEHRKEQVRPVSMQLKKRGPAVYNTATPEQREQCVNCGQGHKLHRCPKYLAMSIEQRWQYLRDNKICFKCAHSKHRRGVYRAESCGVDNCKRPHHATLHYEIVSKPSTSSRDEAVLSVVNNKEEGRHAVILKMCPVISSGPRGEVATYTLLDEGATITLIDEGLAKRVGASGPATALRLQGVNMTQDQHHSELVKISIRGKNQKTPHHIKARTVKNLRLRQQTVPREVLRQRHLRDLKQEDLCYNKAQAGILIGTDHWEKIVSREIRTGGPNQQPQEQNWDGWYTEQYHAD